MYTQCPQCTTVFPIDVPTLCSARGRVRCGRCGAVYFALDALSDAEPDDEGIEPVFESDAPPTLRDPELAATQDNPELFFSPLPEPESEWDDFEEPHAAPFVQAPPVLEEARRSSWRNLLWGLGTAGLLLALALQVGWFERDYLLTHPQLRPLLDRACAQLGCRLPPRRDLDRIRLVSRNIRPHPSVAGALMINATLRNAADFSQPYPRVEIRLADLDGRLIAARVFEPEDYLDARASRRAGMAPGTLLPLVFEVVDPGEEAVAFEFAFR